MSALAMFDMFAEDRREALEADRRRQEETIRENLRGAAPVQASRRPSPAPMKAPVQSPELEAARDAVAVLAIAAGQLAANIEGAAQAAGLGASASMNLEGLAAARAHAKRISRMFGSVHVDQVREAMPDTDLGPWAGAIFKGRDWQRLGDTVSTHSGSHGRRISVWKFVGRV